MRINSMLTDGCVCMLNVSKCCGANIYFYKNGNPTCSICRELCATKQVEVDPWDYLDVKKEEK